MKRYFQAALILLFAGYFNPAVAQDRSYTDSLERAVMRDSLTVSDSTITLVFAVRDNYLLQATQINDSTIEEGEKKSAKQMLVTQTNGRIRELLGDVAYEHYVTMIRRKMIHRPGASGRQPLASQ